MTDNEELKTAQLPVRRDGLVSAKLSILLIGGAAIGLILLMCLTVLIIILVKS
jgi:hypothetical protein